MIANVGSKWEDGKLVFFNRADGTVLLTLDPAGTGTLAAIASTGNVAVGADLEFAVAQYVKGASFAVIYPQVAAADVAKTFWVAPAACEVISAMERHVTVAGQAGALTIEKLTSGEAPGAGDVLLAAAFDLTSAANTPVTKAAVATGVQQLAAGDALCLKLASGNAESYALGTITVALKWL